MLRRRVRHYIEQHRLLPPGARVLVGVSGGVDSVVLMVVLKQLGYIPEAAHVNYQLRGDASDGDEAFVQALCRQRGVSFHLETVDAAAYAEERGLSIQEAARDVRYAFFARVAEREDLRYAALAHHIDDQAETVLLNLLRGTGPEGLAGMPVQRTLAPGSAARLVRPLLGVCRAEIEAFARQEGLAWREDESNLYLKYQRNVVRAAVLPLLEKHFGDAASVNIARSAALVREYVDDAFRQALTAYFEQAARPEARQLDLDALGTLAPVWRRRLILEAFQRWLPGVQRHAALAEAVEALIDTQPGRRVALKGGTVWRGRDGLVFTLPSETGAAAQDAILVHPGATVALEPGLLHVEVFDERPARLDAEAPTRVFADAGRLVFPLIARRWQPGDRFRPLGMNGTKKLSDFLTDAKVPPHRRAGTWVLVSGTEIVWVVGMRLAESVRVEPGTRRFAKFTFIQRA